ncbi:MAG: hypothetical protein ACI4V7_07920 [Succinivibrionaceae bacterium]
MNVLIINTLLKEYTIGKHTPRQNLVMLCERAYNKWQSLFAR